MWLKIVASPLKILLSSVMSVLNIPSTPFPPIFSSLATSQTTPTVTPALSTGSRPQPCATLLVRELSGDLANSSPNTSYEPKLAEYKFRIDIDSEHTPINLPNRDMIFPQEYAATIIGPEDLNLPRHPGASSSSQHSAASRIHTLSKQSELGTSLTMVMANREFCSRQYQQKRKLARKLIVKQLFQVFSILCQGRREIETKTLCKH